MTRRPAFVALPLLCACAACSPADVSFNGVAGVPLDRLALAGQSAHAIELAGPDTVRVVAGPALAVRVSGDDAHALRFVLHDGTLGIGRNDHGNGTATVIVTMPVLDHVTLAGSGSIAAERLSGDARATIGGSGTIALDTVAADALAIDVFGSGGISARGRTGRLALAIAGSGNADLAGLFADSVNLDLAGSGGGSVASKGPVNGAIAGSGHFVVRGTTRCTVSRAGSGTIDCLP